MEDVAPLRLVIRTAVMAAVHASIIRVVGGFAQVGTDRARHTRPIDLWPVLMFTFAEHRYCFNGSSMRCCSIRTVLRHRPFVELARSLRDAGSKIGAIDFEDDR